MTTDDRYRFTESPDSLEAELRAMEYVAQHRFGGRRAEKILKRYYPLDFAIIEGTDKVVALCEVKIRNTPFGKYRNLKISAQKLITASQMFAVFGLPVFLVVHYLDELRMCSLHEYRKKNNRLHLWGRTDRGDPGDMEPSILIPKEDFELIVPVGHAPLVMSRVE